MDDSLLWMEKANRKKESYWKAFTSSYSKKGKWGKIPEKHRLFAPGTMQLASLIPSRLTCSLAILKTVGSDKWNSILYEVQILHVFLEAHGSKVGPTLRIADAPNVQKVSISSTAKATHSSSLMQLYCEHVPVEHQIPHHGPVLLRWKGTGKIPRVQQRTSGQKNQQIWSVPWRKWRVSVIPAVVHPSSQMQFWSGSSCLSRNCQNAKRCDTNCTKHRKRTNSPRGPWAPQLGHMICSCSSC